jgi:hypothetical protein
MHRELNSMEIPSILPLVKAMLTDIGHRGGLREGHFVNSWAEAIENGTGLICVENNEEGEPIGVLGVTFLKDAFSQEPMAYTSFSSRAGKGLYIFFDWEAEKRGVKTLAIVDIEGQERDGGLFESMGYKVSRILTVWARRTPDV